MTDFVYSDVIDRILSKNRWGNEARLAEALGISPNTWTAYKRGARSFGLNDVARICDLLNVSSRWLLYGEDTSSGSLTTLADREGLVEIPRFNVRVAAGAGALALTENVSSYFTVERDWLRRMLPGWAPFNAEVGILEIDGDSMYPTLQEGDLVMAVANPPERIVDAGGIFIVLHHGTLRVKRVHTDMQSGDITLISDNDHYPPEPVPRERLEFDLRILAQVLIRIGKLRPRG